MSQPKAKHAFINQNVFSTGSRHLHNLDALMSQFSVGMQHANKK